MHAQQLLTRHEARTPQGIAMLEKYAKAVGIMKDAAKTPVGKPLSWTFQWYTHWTPKPKASELLRIYPGGLPADWRDVANQAWATCQAHFQPFARQPFFLPWHRWYLWHFESIAKEVLQDETFTLPYWDYAKDPVIPPQFTKKNDPTFKALFNQRGQGVNQGSPIDSQDAIRSMVRSAICQRRYRFTSEVDPGFSAELDGNLHGTIHGQIGGDMEGVPTAAQDPIFWLHHCNIDRLWASWNAAGAKNPSDNTFKNEQFTFADRTAKAKKNACGGALDTAPLGYQYDVLEKRPPECPLAGPESTEKPLLTHRAPGGVTLSNEPTRVALKPVQGQPGREAAAGARTLLIVSKVSAPEAPAPVYFVYVNLPENASGESRAAQRVGQINFFDLVAHGDHRPEGNKFFTFDITKLVPPSARADVAVTIAPSRPTEGNQRPTIGDIRLVRTGRSGS
jgi:tyrosinase